MTGWTADRSMGGVGKPIAQVLIVVRVPFVSEFRPIAESHIRPAALTFFA